jgi:hypothetical protein
MVAQPAGALGIVVLTAIADAVSISTAMYVGAVVLAVAAPLYLPAWRQAAGRDAGRAGRRPGDPIRVGRHQRRGGLNAAERPGRP